MKIGKACQAFRISIGKKQSDVASDLGFSGENISAFENGRNHNMMIFLWYIEKGFDVDKYRKENL